MAVWEEVIGSGPVLAASSSYREYTFTGRIEMDWPLESNSTNVIADYTAFNSIAPGEVVLPDATKGSPGVIGEFVNDGQGDITVVTRAGATVVVMQPGQTHRIILRANTTTGGVWRTFLAGAGTAQVQAGSLASPTIVALGNTLTQAVPVLDIGSNYTVSTGERGHLVNWLGGVGTLTLDLAEELGDGFFFHLRNSGEGALTLAPQSPSTVDRIGEATFNPGQSGIVVGDGDNFYTISRSSTGVSGGSTGGGTATFSYVTIDVAGTGDRTLDTDEVGNIAFRFTGTLTGNRVIIVPPTLAQYWVRNNTTGTFTLTITTQNAIDGGRPGVAVTQGGTKILYSTGSDVVDASNANLSTPISLADGGTGATTASAARTNLGITSVGNSVATAISQAAARSAIGAMASTNPLVSGNMSFEASGNGVRLSGGGQLYDDAVTHQATVLRLNSNDRLSIRSDDDLTEYARLDGASGAFKWRGGDVAVLGGDAGNIAPSMVDFLGADTLTQARSALFGGSTDRVIKRVQFVAPVFNQWASGAIAVQFSQLTSPVFFPTAPASTSHMFIIGSALFLSQGGTALLGSQCVLQAQSASGAWGNISSLAINEPPGSDGSRYQLWFAAYINVASYAAGVPMRIAFHSSYGAPTHLASAYLWGLELAPVGG